MTKQTAGEQMTKNEKATIIVEFCDGTIIIFTSVAASRSPALTSTTSLSSSA